MKKNYNNSGVSLIVLVITIIIALILIVATAISATRSIDNASINTFIKDITGIQDETESYYLTNHEMPFLVSSTVMNKDELLAISNSPDLLIDELTENGDLDAQFYTIDLEKIGVTKIAYGNKKLGANDIFVISFPLMTVYYPYGLDARSTTYFSITSRISNEVIISQNLEDISATTVVSSGSITVTKNNGKANKMGVNIEVIMDSDELLYMSVSGDPGRLITTVNGKNIFGFDLLSTIISNSETIKVPTLTQVEADYIELGTKPLSDRYVDILKYKNSEIIGKVRIDLSNFSMNLPTITGAALSSYTTINTVKLTLANSDSGIKEIRYEYLTKFSESGTIENYYNNISDFDLTYMSSQAKKAKLTSNLTTTIDAPKNVRSIKVAVIDNAGNINLYNQIIAPNLYIGYVLNSSTMNSLQLTANMYSINGIKTITFSKSEDGINFNNEQLYTINTTTNGTTSKQCTPYTNFTVNDIYIKIVATNYNDTITETRIIKINLQSSEQEPESELGLELGINVIAPENATVNGLPPAYNNPIVPKGFKAINVGTVWPTDWNTGLVIEDASGNQFVWVPVDGINVPYTKWCLVGIPYNSVTDGTLPTDAFEVTQISKYGGFYIARYESMFDYNNGSIRAGSKKSTIVSTSSWANKRNLTHSGELWNFIDYADAKLYSESMAARYGYDTSAVLTTLVTGKQWDTTMKWIHNSGKSVTDSRAWGNYTNAVAPANVIGIGVANISGFSEFWKANNIYDLSGNMWEWTNEVTGNDAVYRGGGYGNDGTTGPASCRNYYTASAFGVNISFRISLNLK